MADEPGLVVQLQRRVADWVTRVAPRIRDEQALAKLEITLRQPQADDDGTLYLDFEVVETTVPSSGGGRVAGVPFDASDITDDQIEDLAAEWQANGMPTLVEVARVAVESPNPARKAHARRRCADILEQRNAVTACTTRGCAGRCATEGLAAAGWMQVASGWICTGCQPL